MRVILYIEVTQVYKARDIKRLPLIKENRQIGGFLVSFSLAIRALADLRVLANHFNG